MTGPAAPELIARLRQAALTAQSDREAREILRKIRSLTMQYQEPYGGGYARPTDLALKVDSAYQVRPHTDYISTRITQAVRDVEGGVSRKLAISTPPRVGKSTLISLYTPLWVLRKHPDWDVVLVSHEGGLATSWGRQIRRTIEDHPSLGIGLVRDYGAASEWETSEGGHVLARGVRSSLTGRGARVMVIDDPVKDYVEAHSETYRQGVWDWWLSVAQTRLEPPSLVMVVMTRWHEDDFIGRLLSPEHEGDPGDWEVINLPALAEAGDLLQRSPGDPLFSPLLDESREEALDRWAGLKRSVGSYLFDAMFQQHPSPAKGSIFDADWWRFWTRDPSAATDDGRVVYLDPEVDLQSARWVDSWDCTFTGGDGSDYVVGQRWATRGQRYYLTAQRRDRLSFTETLAAMKVWADSSHPDTPVGSRFVRERLIEDKANGPAVIDSLKDSIQGIIPVSPRASKESRARAVTPRVEAGEVYLPLPTDPGNEWVGDLLSELRQFPSGAHDDQVDALTQALLRLTVERPGTISNPNRLTSITGRGGGAGSRAAAARSSRGGLRRA